MSAPSPTLAPRARAPDTMYVTGSSLTACTHVAHVSHALQGFDLHTVRHHRTPTPTATNHHRACVSPTHECTHSHPSLILQSHECGSSCAVLAMRFARVHLRRVAPAKCLARSQQGNCYTAACPRWLQKDCSNRCRDPGRAQAMWKSTCSAACKSLQRSNSLLVYIGRSNWNPHV